MVGFPTGGSSGVLPYNVSTSTTMGLSTVWRCLDVLAYGVKQLPWVERLRNADLPLSRLTLRPWEAITRRDWTDVVVRTMALYDVAYLLKLEPYDQEGVPSGLWPIPPTIILPRTVDNLGLIPPMEYTVGRTTISADRIIVLRRAMVPGVPEYLAGFLQLARAELAAALAANNYASRYWQGGGSPTTVLETEANLNDVQATNLGNRWSQRRSQGPDHPVILSNGLKARDWGADPTTASAVEARQAQDADTVRYFGVPPRLANVRSWDSETYDNAEEENLDLLKYGLQNYIDAIEDGITDLLPGERELKILTSSLTEAAQLSRYQALQLAVGGPWMTVPEARDAEGLPPTESSIAPLQESQRPLTPIDLSPQPAITAATTGSAQ